MVARSWHTNLLGERNTPELGGIGASLVIKFVKSTKVASWAADELRIDQFLSP
jgi:hypothetical protein